MEDCKLKTEMLREKYKEYLKPIDPLRPLGRESSDLMPPPGKVKQTCFTAKEKFPRGEQLIRKLGKRTMLDRLDEYNKFRVPLQCPCDTIPQGGDPARKKRRGRGPTKAKRVKKEPEHIVCSVNNLPLAYTESQQDPQPVPIGKQNNRNAKANLRTAAPVRNIKKDKDMSQQAISSQRKYIRAKADEIQKKSMALQQKMAKPKVVKPAAAKKAQSKKLPLPPSPVDETMFGVKSKPTAPRRPVVPPKKQPTSPSSPCLTGATGQDQALPETAMSMPISAGAQQQTKNCALGGSNSAHGSAMELAAAQFGLGQALVKAAPIRASYAGGSLPCLPAAAMESVAPQLPKTPTPTPRAGMSSKQTNPGGAAHPYLPVAPKESVGPQTSTLQSSFGGANSMPTTLDPMQSTPNTSCAPVQNGSLCGITSKRTNPRRPVVPPKKQRQITSTPTTASTGGIPFGPYRMPPASEPQVPVKPMNAANSITPKNLAFPTQQQAQTTATKALGSSLSMPFLPSQQFVPQLPPNPLKSCVEKESMDDFPAKPGNASKSVVPPQKQQQEVAPTTAKKQKSMPYFVAQPFVPQQKQPSADPVNGSYAPAQQSNPPTAPAPMLAGQSKQRRQSMGYALAGNPNGPPTMPSTLAQQSKSQRAPSPIGTGQPFKPQQRRQSMGQAMAENLNGSSAISATLAEQSKPPATAAPMMTGQPFKPQQRRKSMGQAMAANPNGPNAVPSTLDQQSKPSAMLSGQPFTAQQRRPSMGQSMAGYSNGPNTVPSTLAQQSKPPTAPSPMLTGQTFKPQQRRQSMGQAMAGNFNGSNAMPSTLDQQSKPPTAPSAMTTGQPFTPQQRRPSMGLSMAGYPNGSNTMPSTLAQQSKPPPAHSPFFAAQQRQATAINAISSSNWQSKKTFCASTDEHSFKAE
ncbi:nascent polypeptide-associated complex subunit alpha, muscle-specific form-like [Drosophila hydei]|uniref:Nascent polypeptide-associated complex subunit alpha, muscle-specific form-like n=1 Tax=Drosophila hydei TaxID=7224 RepID=A0A6J2SU02_DROHY|nr:nascent polypeptide-associated complex subunit alpha, muscle-specific form-like [Drosophila hydei]